MNLPSEWQQVLSSPVIILLLIIAAASILLLFITPIILRISSGKSFKKIIKPIRSNPKPALALTAIILILAAGGYLFYYFNQPIRIVSAAQFKLEKGKAVKELQQRQPGTIQKAEVALVDLRSREEYAVEHLKGSASLPAEQIVKQNLKLDLDIAVYSSASRFEEVREVAEIVRKNAEPTKAKYKIGKIYIIRDGFEGLKAASLATESGMWD